jgi:hypothetical protein
MTDSAYTCNTVYSTSKNYDIIMAFNLSEVDLDLYIAANAAVQVSLLVVIILPAAIFSIICSVAIGFTFIINWQMRVVLINIFATEVFHWLGYTVEHLAFAPRVLDKENSIVSCRVFFFLIITASTQKIAAIVIYSIIVYVFLKYGVKKIKWYVISLALVITWAVSVTIGILLCFDQFAVFSNNGYCAVNTTAYFST